MYTCTFKETFAVKKVLLAGVAALSMLSSSAAHADDIRCDGNIKISLDRVLIFDANVPRVCSIPIDQAGECGEQGATSCTVVGHVLYSRREKMYGGKIRVYYLRSRQGAAALSVLSASAAHAANHLPIGKWSLSNENEELALGIWFEGGDTKCDSVYIIEIKQNELVGWEYSCRFTEVKAHYDPTIPATTKTSGEWVTHVKAKCGTCGYEWRASFVFYISKTVLFMRSHRSKKIGSS
jgi:hypothetical protein